MANIRYQAEALKPLAEITYPAGTNIHQLINDLNIPENLHDHLMVFRNGGLVKDYNLIIEEHENLTIAVVQRGGGGDKNGILGIVASIAIAYAAPYAAPAVAGATGMSVAVATAAITIVGTLVVSALIPPASLGGGNTNTQDFEEALAYNLTGQTNNANLYGGVPAIYGQIRFFPFIAAQTKIVQIGKKTVLSSLYDFGLGDVLIDGVQIGTQPAVNFGATFIDHVNTKTPNLKYVTNTVGYDQLAFNLSSNELKIVTRPNADGAAVTMVFPRGLAKFNDQGNPTNYEVELMVEFRKQGTSDWQRISASQFKTDVVVVKDNVVDQQVASYDQNFTVSPAQNIRYGNGTDSVSQVQSGFTKCNPNWFKEGTRKSLPDPVLDIDEKIDDKKAPRFVVYQNNNPYNGWNVANQNNGTWWFAGNYPPPLQPYQRVSSGQACYIPNAISTTVVISGATAQPNSVRVEVFFAESDTYEIRVKRSGAESTNTRILDQLQITSIETLKNESPVVLDYPHTLLEMQVQSSERLTGNVDNLSAFVSKRIRSINENGFINGLIETGNPALIALDILTNGANRSPLRDDQIDFSSFVELANFCSEEISYEQGGKTYTHQKYEFNGLVVGSTVQEAVNNVLANGRAQLLMLQNGKFGVLIDRPKTIPKQLITPANSWGFKGSRSYPYYPDALRVEYVDPELNWATTEVIVYSDGFSAANAKKFETLKTTGVINYDQAYRYARYMMAQARYRSEIFSVNMDIENLSVVRGDLVLVQHDVPKLGGPSLRVVEISGTTLKFNQRIEIPVDASYTVRTLDGDVKSGRITSQIDPTTVKIETADSSITPDALLAIGVTNKVTSPYLVLAVNPSPDLTATIDLAPYSAQVYEEGALPIWNPNFSGDLISSPSVAVKNMTAVQSITYVDRQPQVDIGIKWEITGNINMLKRVDVYYLVDGQEGQYCGSSDSKELIWKMSPIRKKELLNQPSGKFVATPFSKLDLQGENAELIYAIKGDETPPLPIEGFGVNILNNSLIDIFWKKTRDIDIATYEIRFTPNTKDPQWNAASHLATVDWETNRTSAGARTGSYGIMVKDTSANKSLPQWLRTSVETLPSLDFIVAINDAPTWSGNKINCNTKGGDLMLNGDFGSVTDRVGYYEFLDVYDANQIQELRCISYLEGYGVSESDFMSNWIPLSSADPIASATESDFDYWLEAATTNDQLFMDDWIPLSGENANPIEGGGIGWQPWRRIESTDLSGQLYKFRIAMASYNPLVNIKMTSGRTDIDVLDRFESYPDLEVTTSGTRIDFNPPFRDIPAIAVSIDGNSKDVRYQINSKTENSAEIVLIDNLTNQQATGKIDVNVQGYGKVRTTSL